MPLTDYQKKIVDYYQQNENAYKDAWALDKSLAIHYGYWDKNVQSFAQSLLRMNEVMAEAAMIKPNELVLDAGCGVGGSSIFLATAIGCKAIGITLSERQVEQAKQNAINRKVESSTVFAVMDYSNTTFPDNSFDVVWGCESICYADDKAKFIKEAFRLLKPGGRVVIADGFVSKFENNDHPFIRKWLDGWQVNYLETMERFCGFMQEEGFANTRYSDITSFTSNSSGRLYRFYFLASLYSWWKRISSGKKFSDIQKKNILACKYQHLAMNKKLWQYGLVVGEKAKQI